MSLNDILQGVQYFPTIFGSFVFDWQGRQATQLHPRQAGLGELLAPEVGLDEVDLVVDPLLHGGAVPAPLSELVLTLVNGSDGSESDGVHEARVPLAELDLKQRIDGHWRDLAECPLTLITD